MESGKDGDLKQKSIITRFAEVEQRVTAIISENAELRNRVAELEEELARARQQGKELENFHGMRLRIREKIERILRALEAIEEKNDQESKGQRAEGR